jgi:dTDP-4-dehydrorhamnose reductase
MRILVTGREGQVARSLAERAPAHRGVEIIASGRPELDLLKPQSVRSAILSAKPDIVVSAAAIPRSTGRRVNGKRRSPSMLPVPRP